MELEVMTILTGIDGAEQFNYFFTLVSYFGVLAIMIGAIVGVLRK